MTINKDNLKTCQPLVDHFNQSMGRKANRKDINTANRGVSLEHRHFSFIAATIAEMPDHAETLRVQKTSVAHSFADACRRTNPRFDLSRFLAACGVKD